MTSPSAIQTALQIADQQLSDAREACVRCQQDLASARQSLAKSKTALDAHAGRMAERARQWVSGAQGAQWLAQEQAHRLWLSQERRRLADHVCAQQARVAQCEQALGAAERCLALTRAEERALHRHQQRQRQARRTIEERAQEAELEDIFQRPDRHTTW